MSIVQRFTPCLWFDDRAEEAAETYVGIFKNSKIGTISRFGEAQRAMNALLEMKKLDINVLKKAYTG